MAYSAPVRPKEHVSLPELLSRQPKNTIPRRYELTKPVLIQSFTHQNIVSLGNQIHQKTLLQCEEERSKAVHATIERLKAEAEIEKQEALMKAAEQAKIVHEQQVAKIHKANMMAMKAEGLKIEAEMKNQMLKQKQQEREIWQNKMAEAVAAKEEEWKIICDNRIEQARKEEKERKEQELRQKEKEHAEEKERVIAEGKKEKEDAVQMVIAQKEKERAHALEELKKREEQDTKEKIQRQKQLYEKQILTLKDLMKEIESKVDDKLQIITQLHKEKYQVQKELLATREEFETFINDVKPYQPEPKVEYVLPPLKSFTISGDK